MTRVAVALALVIGLAAGVWWLWPAADPITPTTSAPTASPGSTVVTSTTTHGSTSTTESHIVETVEEAEEILRDLWFGWFEGIYLQDEERIREVVVREEEVATARSRFGEVSFAKPPEPGDLEFSDTEILRSEPSCLAVWSEFTPHFLAQEGSSSGVNVLRRVGESWKSFSYWLHRGDLWEEDCAVSLP